RGKRVPTRLTRNPAEDSAPVWSPDGTRLLFVSARTGDYEIFEMNAKGSGVENVSRDHIVADVAPNWAGPTLGRARAARTLATTFPCGSLSGGDGNDNIQGLSGGDRICARKGDDVVHGNAGPDLI